jgi:threonine/homoserine/homoserine lactone efflux protein
VLVFLAVSALVIVVPGQDTALTIRNSLLGSRREGVATAAGVTAGLTAWTLATAFGVGAVLARSEPAFEALRLAGAAYLVWLGLRTLLALRSEPRSSQVRVFEPPERLRSRTAFRQGLLSNLGNPKILAFFTSLLPQFSASSAGLLAHGLLFCALTFAWLASYALAVSRARRFLDRTRDRRAIDAVTGVVLVAFGLRLAAERR